jgi:hypothetical protein
MKLIYLDCSAIGRAAHREGDYREASDREPREDCVHRIATTSRCERSLLGVHEVSDGGVGPRVCVEMFVHRLVPAVPAIARSMISTHGNTCGFVMMLLLLLLVVAR